MAIQLPQSDEADEPISAINTTPLVDVMLVLLIIFLITVPAATTSVKLKLPAQRVEAREMQANDVLISVDRNGSIYWHDTPLRDAADLHDRLRRTAALQPQPSIQIRGDQQARYESVGRVMQACQTAGIAKVTFITEPPALGG